MCGGGGLCVCVKCGCRCGYRFTVHYILCVEFVYLCMCVGVFIDVCVGHLLCIVHVHI